MGSRPLRILGGALVGVVLIVSCSSPTASSSSSPSTIGSQSFSNVTLELLSYGQSNLLFSISPSHKVARSVGTSASSTSYYSLFQFTLGSNSTAILGFNVYRSTDGTNFTRIGTKNYGTATSVNSLVSYFTYYDYDATLSLGTTYYYKVQAFDASGNYSVYSPVASAVFLAPFVFFALNYIGYLVGYDPHPRSPEDQ